jgi:hypothetical protein
VVGICNSNDDSGFYDHSVSDITTQRESLGKHHRSHTLSASSSRWLLGKQYPSAYDSFC